MMKNILKTLSLAVLISITMEASDCRADACSALSRCAADCKDEVQPGKAVCTGGCNGTMGIACGAEKGAAVAKKIFAYAVKYGKYLCDVEPAQCH